MVFTIGEKPKQKITVSGSVEIQSDSISSIVVLRENAIADASIMCNDNLNKTYLSGASLNNSVDIEYKYEDGDNTYIKVFSGKVVELSPNLSIAGENCVLKAYGNGIGLKRMRCAQEYGTQSNNSAYTTLRGILTTTTANFGVIPGYVVHILGTAAHSGYTMETDYVWNTGSTFKYLNFPYEPVSDCLRDISMIMSAGGAPVHWIVTPDNYLCMAPVGDHHVTGSGTNVVETKWPTTGSCGTLVVGTNMIVSDFKHCEPEANYVIGSGIFENPLGDSATELSSGSWEGWGDHGIEGETFYAEDNANSMVGNYSIRGQGNYNDEVVFFWYPKDYSLNINIESLTTQKSKPTVDLWYWPEAYTTDHKIILLTSGSFSHYFYKDIGSLVTEGVWSQLSLDLNDGKWTEVGSPDWSHITAIGWKYKPTANPYDVYGILVDNFSIHGAVMRGAYHSTNIASYNCEIKLVTDNLAKSDSLNANDDSSPLAQLLKAELYRSMTSPLIGTIKISLDPRIMPGQIIHVHASKVGATFKINKDFRATEVKHSFSEAGAFTFLTLTDDVSNSYPMQPLNNYNIMLKASSPDFQDRDRASMKGYGIDIDLTLLSKDYA